MNFGNNNMNFQNNMTGSSNFVPPMNQMNQINQMNQNTMNMNPNSLYMNIFQQTWQNFQPTVKLVDVNFNNMTNILSLLNLPIIVPCHSQHPLIHCKTVGRIMPGTYWKCNCCFTDYSYNVPTFYCTACDFDLCQRCLLSLSAFMIAIYNYNMSSLTESTNFINISHYHADKHKHPIVKIVRDQTYAEIPLRCNLCEKTMQKTEQFYYCSLCNYCICLNCYQQRNNNNSTEVPGYLSNNQI